MAATLDDILECHAQNGSRFNALQTHIDERDVIPFVGAGMSKFMFPSWSEFVSQLGHRACVDREVEELLHASDFEGALETVHSKLGRELLEEEVQQRFGPAGHEEQALQGAGLHLPALSAGPVITTNYDCLIESFFQHALHPFYKIVPGGRRDAVVAALDNDEPFLLKIHGTFDEADSRVLTRADYDNHYGNTVEGKFNPDLPLPKLLLRAFGARRLLFVGCSLTADRTMALLRYAHTKSDRALARHFAIVPRPANPEATVERERFLAEHGIQAIFHPPGDYEAINVLLAALADSSWPQAYDKAASGHPLSRERLTYEDIAQQRAVKPSRVEEVVDRLGRGESVAVQGEPGTGKSAFAAWVNWLAGRKGQLVAAFFGRDLQREGCENACDRLKSVPSHRILLVDDIHLAEPILNRIKSLPWSSKRRFLLLGRAPYVDEALRKGKLPEVTVPVFDLTTDSASSVAENLALKYLDPVAATQLLQLTGKDLVFTKWLLEVVLLHHQSPDSSHTNAAVDKLEELRGDFGDESLRLFLTLAAFGSMELWCPEGFLVSALGFTIEAIDQLRRPHEVERRAYPEGSGHFALQLRRHPKLCKLFLDAAPRLGLVFEHRVFGTTCAKLGLRADAVNSYGFTSVVLAAAREWNVVDLGTLEWRLVYGGRKSEYLGVVKAATELLLARFAKSVGSEFSLDERVRRLELAYAAANGQRRLQGASAARVALEELRDRLGVSGCPTEAFSLKGYILYQDAYLMRLDNAGKAALRRFEESAVADEAWATDKGSLVHRGKAAMSRIAACAYRIDLAVFSSTTTTGLQPDKAQLADVCRELTDQIRSLTELLVLDLDERGRVMAEGFRTNALLHLAETFGWLDDEVGVREQLGALRPSADPDDSLQLATGLAMGALALTQQHYDQAITELHRQPEERAKRFAGEGSGKTGVMLLISYLQAGRQTDAEKTRAWLLSDECPLDAGNGIAKAWTTKGASAFFEGSATTLKPTL